MTEQHSSQIWQTNSDQRRISTILYVFFITHEAPQKIQFAPLSGGNTCRKGRQMQTFCAFFFAYVEKGKKKTNYS